MGRVIQLSCLATSRDVVVATATLLFQQLVSACLRNRSFNLDVRLGLKTLAYKSLIQISTKGEIVMHKLLQQMGREDPGKRQILIENDEICDVLENNFGSGSVMGISLDISTLSSDVYISPEAFKRIRNLRFLSIYKTNSDKDNRVHVPEDMNFPPRLRFLHWEEYPGKCLPLTFRPEYLVELNLQSNKLEKLWEGIQPLTNLKKMSLAKSKNLKELPDLSNATNLESLNLQRCVSLVEIPSSIRNLQKLKRLDMVFCGKLRVVPTHFNLASLESLDMSRCSQLRNFPDFFRNITTLTITGTILQYVPESIRLWSCLQVLIICGNWNTHPAWIIYVNGMDADIEKIPDWIKDLHGLKELHIYGCPKIASLPQLPSSLRELLVYNCESLETLMPFPFESQIEDLHFFYCMKLGQEARRVITQQSMNAWLPGRNVPDRAIGNSLTIPSGTDVFRYCIVISPKQPMVEYADLLWRQHGSPDGEHKIDTFPMVKGEHLFIRLVKLPYKLESEVLSEFSTTSKDIDIIECGFQSFTDKTNRSCESRS